MRSLHSLALGLLVSLMVAATVFGAVHLVARVVRPICSPNFPFPPLRRIWLTATPTPTAYQSGAAVGDVGDQPHPYQHTIAHAHGLSSCLPIGSATLWGRSIRWP